MAEEQTPQGVQDPVQQQAEPAAATAPVPQAPPAPPQQVGQAPWSQSLQQAFTPEQAAAVDAWARANVQPYVTRLEQQYAETEAARQLLGAFEADADAANVAVQRQLYGDEYGDQFAAAIGRQDLVVNAPPQVQQPQQVQQPAQPAPDPRYEEMYKAWSDQQAEQQYEDAKSSFLSDPQYADIKPELFDGFVAGAETWEDAVNNYRAFAAQFAQANAPEQVPEQAPPVMGSGATGGAGSTPTYPKETLSEAIDGIFAENKPLAPPVIGS